MKSIYRITRVICFLCVVSVALLASSAQTFQIIDSFDGPDGMYPYYISLAQGLDGNLYGTTYAGGVIHCVSNIGCGTVFRVTGNELTSIYKFPCQESDCSQGQFPLSGLVLATDGNFYGVTSDGGTFGQCIGGCGTVFRITPKGELTTIYSFCSRENCGDGYDPLAPLIQASDGYLYGTTNAGGANQGGTIFKISLSGVFTPIHSFRCEYCSPGVGPLVEGPDGNFYGTAADGLHGTIFKVAPNGRFTNLYTFCSQPNCTDGDGPDALFLSTDGNFYGTTAFGGLQNCGLYFGGGCGTVFRLSPEGYLSTLYRFCAQPTCVDGATPLAGMIQGTDGAFYGTTSEGGDLGTPECAAQVVGCGTIFRITPAGSLATVYRFQSPSEGYQPTGGLVQRTDGDFYGTTQYGGAAPGNGFGTVFRFSMGLQPFVALVRNSGKVGQMVPILGQGFTQTTGVAVDGIPATFIVVSDTLITARIPAGATAGYVTVTTPGGMLTSNLPFRVIP